MKKLKLSVLLLVFWTVFPMTSPASEKDDVKKGNILYNNGDYAGAAKLYEKAALEKSSSGIPDLNRGAALYKKSAYSKAIEAFNKSIASGRADLVHAADYNIGNSTYKMGALKDKADKEKKDIKKTAEVYATALQYYKRAIDLDPSDRDAKFNYEFVAKKLEELKPLFQIKQEEEKKKEQEQKEQDKKDQKDQNQQDQQNQGQQQNKDQQSQQDEDKEKAGQPGGESQSQEKKEEQNKPEGQEPGGEGAKQKEEKPESAEGQDKSAADQKKEQEDQKEQAAGAGEEEKGREVQEGQGPEEAGKPEEKQGGLAAYQGAGKQSEPGEMTEQEAKMLLEGYKGEEATGRTIKMRQKPINMSEPAKDW